MGMPPRLVLAVMSVALLTAFGGSGGGASGLAPATPAQVASIASPSPSPRPPSPSPDPRSPSPVPPAAPEPLPPPAPAQAPMVPAAAQGFALVAVGDPAARGTVTVAMESGRAVITVTAGGLPAGSTHSVHLHFGSCPSAGSHILVLGTLRAGGAGSGTLTAAVNPAFSGPGHFVIIYMGPSAGPLGACAALG